MSDEVGSTEGAAPADQMGQTGASARESAGAMLRQAREAAGVDMASLAAALKVSVKKLEALEADRHDLLPDAVFMRGLASGVCRVLKIDAAPVLARLPQTATPRLEFDEVGLNTPFHTPGDQAKAPFLDRLSRPMVLAALAVLMGALVLIFFPTSEQRAEIDAIVARVPAESASAPAVAETKEAVAPAHTPAKPQPVAAKPQPEPVKAQPAPTVVARATPTAPSATAPAPVPAASSPDAPVRKRVASTGIIVFKSSGPSWVEVTDANGTIQLSRQIDVGDTVGASGPLPLNVTIGRADLTEVQVRGKPFALESVSKNGVARFEVK